MKKHLLIIAILCFFSTNAQVTQIWTDYNTFWTSSSTSINTTQPNTDHNVLAFRWNGTNYSTGVNNARLTSNGVSFTATKFRGLPINSVPLTGGGSYFIGLGALVDGSQTTADNIVNAIPFSNLIDGVQKARFLTDGVQGLNLGSCLTNIPTGTEIRFNLSSSGISEAALLDANPDIFITQIAQPVGTNDQFRFVNSSGVTVGNAVNIVLTDNVLYPIVGNWNLDLYNNDGNQPSVAPDRVNTSREMRFFAANLSAFGITTGNRGTAVALIYTPGGNSDPAFLAFNEPSLGIATKLVVTAQPVTSNCDGTMPTSFTVRLEDQFGYSVEQAGISITASMETGPGQLLGTLTATTNASGVATFSGLTFEIGGVHTIRFSNSSLDAGITTSIAAPVGCPDNIWTGNSLVNSNWNTTANWNTGTIPNANSNVEIPTGRPRYPILTADAGAKDLTLGVNATINLNGWTFAINGNITKDATSKITASADNSVLYMSGSAAQVIPSGIILNGDIANLTVENAGGVTNADNLKLTQVLLVRAGTFATGNAINMVCRFTPTRRTAQIGPIGTTGIISGNVTVEQCFPARRAFRFVTSTVTTATSIRANWQEGASAWNNNPNPGYGTHITGVGANGSNPALTDGVNGLDWQPSGASSLFSFNNATQTWSAVSSTLGTLTAGVPYRMLIRGNRSTNIQVNTATPTNTILRSTGTVVKGPITVTGLNATNNAYSLVGNPFQAQVDMSIVKNNSTNIKPFMYVYDPTLGGTPTVGAPGGRGAYVSINPLTGEKSNPASNASIYLQPYQAFYVQTDNLGVAPQIVFNELDKSTSRTQTTVFRSANDDDVDNGRRNQFIDLALFNQSTAIENDTSLDGLRVSFRSNNNNGVDSNDAEKFTNSDENISRKIGQTLISMETRDIPQNGEILPLSITQYRATNYTMQIGISAFANKNVYLKDYYNNQNVLLANGATATYNFSVDAAIPASINPDRFAFEIQDAALGINQNKFGSTFTLFPNPANGTSILLNANVTFENAQIEIYNLIGQKVSELNADFGINRQINIPISTLTAGVYMVNVKTNTGEEFTSKFVRK